MNEIVMRSEQPIPAVINNNEIVVDWSQFPIEMLRLCEPTLELMSALGLTEEDSQWSRSVALSGNSFFPVQKLELIRPVADHEKATIEKFFSTLIAENKHCLDLFKHSDIQPIENDAIDDIIARAAKELRGKKILHPVSIRHPDIEEIVICGRFSALPEAPPEFDPRLREMVGYVDRPSLWNNTVSVRVLSANGNPSLTEEYIIAVDKNIGCLQDAQRQQQKCRICVQETLNANKKVVKRIVSIEMLEHKEDGLF